MFVELFSVRFGNIRFLSIFENIHASWKTEQMFKKNSKPRECFTSECIIPTRDNVLNIQKCQVTVFNERKRGILCFCFSICFFVNLFGMCRVKSNWNYDHIISAQFNSGKCILKTRTLQLKIQNERKYSN